MFNFEAKHENQFVKELFWKYMREIIPVFNKSPKMSNKTVPFD